MSSNPKLENNEIDLGELIAALWAHKIIISLFTCLCVFFAGYHTLTVEKKFTADATFKIDQNDSNTGFSLSGELGAKASLAGLSNGTSASSSKELLERAMGREFIIKMKKSF